MSNFITLTCPNCGGMLEITKDTERFACVYCGTEHIVKSGGGILSLAPVYEDFKSIKTGVDRTASELAIKRLEKEIAELELQIQNFRRVRAWKSSSFPVLILIGVSLVSFWSLIFILAGKPGSWLITLMGFFVALLSYYFIRRDSEKRNAFELSTKNKLAPYEKELENKKDELDYHHSLVKINKQ